MTSGVNTESESDSGSSDDFAPTSTSQSDEEEEGQEEPTPKPKASQKKARARPPSSPTTPRPKKKLREATLPLNDGSADTSRGAKRARSPEGRGVSPAKKRTKTKGDDEQKAAVEHAAETTAAKASRKVAANGDLVCVIMDDENADYYLDNFESFAVAE